MASKHNKLNAMQRILGMKVKNEFRTGNLSSSPPTTIHTTQVEALEAQLVYIEVAKTLITYIYSYLTTCIYVGYVTSSA